MIDCCDCFVLFVWLCVELDAFCYTPTSRTCSGRITEGINLEFRKLRNFIQLRSIRLKARFNGIVHYLFYIQSIGWWTQLTNGVISLLEFQKTTNSYSNLDWKLDRHTNAGPLSKTFGTNLGPTICITAWSKYFQQEDTTKKKKPKHHVQFLNVGPRIPWYSRN